MDTSFIIGVDKIKSDFGYFPSFHDGVIDKIEISSEGITFIIDIQVFPKGMSSYPKVKMMFYEVENYYIEGEIYGCASIILDMQFIENQNYIEVQISSSSGASGTIQCKKVQVDLL